MIKTNRYSGIIRLTSFFLSSFMLFQTVAVADEIIPNSTPEIQAFSAVTEPTEFGNEASEAGQTDSAESNLVAEVESLRGEFEKHFINEDGSYVAVSYCYPIHYEDEDGAWQEIDTDFAYVLGLKVHANIITTLWFKQKPENGRINPIGKLLQRSWDI